MILRKLLITTSGTSLFLAGAYLLLFGHHQYPIALIRSNSAARNFLTAYHIQQKSLLETAGNYDGNLTPAPPGALPASLADLYTDVRRQRFDCYFAISRQSYTVACSTFQPTLSFLRYSMDESGIIRMLH